VNSHVTDTYRITILKAETDIIAIISARPIGQAWLFVILSAEDFRTDVIVFKALSITAHTTDLIELLTGHLSLTKDNISFNNTYMIYEL
jgi:hypothetical protein